MSNQKKVKKMLSFDLSKDKLKQAGFDIRFPFAMKPYQEIGKAMKSLGFEHLQKSAYKSSIKLTPSQLNKAVVTLCQCLPWLPDCVDKMHVTDISNERDFDLSKVVAHSKDINRVGKHVSPAKPERPPIIAVKDIQNLKPLDRGEPEKSLEPPEKPERPKSSPPHNEPDERDDDDLDL